MSQARLCGKGPPPKDAEKHLGHRSQADDEATDIEAAPVVARSSPIDPGRPETRRWWDSSNA